jgi:hypothetical protein
MPRLNLTKAQCTAAIHALNAALAGEWGEGDTDGIDDCTQEDADGALTKLQEALEGGH